MKREYETTNPNRKQRTKQANTTQNPMCLPVKGVPNLRVRNGKYGVKKYYIKAQIDGKEYSRAIDIFPTDSKLDMCEKVQIKLKALKAESEGQVIYKPVAKKIFPQLVADYIESRQLAHSTIKALLAYLKGFSLNEITNDTAAQRLLNSELKPQTIATRTAMINAFYRWIMETQHIAISLPFPNKISHAYTPRERTATPDEIKKTLELLETKGDTEFELFARLIIFYGVRISTAYACTIDTLQPDGMHFYNVKCKRPYKYIIPETDAKTSALFRTLSARGYLWSPKQKLVNLKLRLLKLLRIFGTKQTQHGAEFLTPHSFRHTLATNAIQNGVAPEIAAQLLDHASINTTLATYARFSPSQLKDALDKINTSAE